MIHDVSIPRNVELEEYYVLRGIVDDLGKKKVVKEKEFSNRPTLSDIATFLEESKASFASLVTNYRLADNELPFM